MADKIQIPVEILPHRFEEVQQQLSSVIDPKTLSPDAQILFQSIMGSFNIAKAEMESQMASNKFNIGKLNLKSIDKQLGSLIKTVQEDLGNSLPEAFVLAQQELEKLGTSLTDNQNKQKKLLESMKSMPDVSERVKSQAPTGFKKFGVAENEEKTLERIAELKKQIANTTDGRKLGPLEKELDYQNQVYKIQKDQSKQLDKKQEQLNQLQSSEESILAFMEVQREKQGESIKAQKGSVDPRVQELLKIRQAVNTAIVNGTSFQAEYNKVVAQGTNEEKKQGKAVDKTNESLTEKAGRTLILNTIYNQLKQVLRGSVQTIRELDKALTDASVVTGMTRKQTWELIGAYQDLAKKTGLATSQVAGVVTQFLRQGRSLADAMQLAEVAAKSAKVAGISANEAVNFLTSAVNGFQLSADQAEDIADKFAAIAARSATSFSELASAMSRVSPTAKSAGVSVDFMMGVIAKGIETTREAPESIGTAFKTIFARMREVTDLGKSMEDGMNLNRVEKALLSVGVPLRDVGGQFRNLENVLTDVGNKWETLTSVEQAYLATALAGSRQQPRLLAIFNDFARTKELIEISSEATGGLELQHIQYMEGMEAALTRLKTAWEGFITSLVSADIIVFFFNLATSAIEGFSSIVQAIGPSMAMTIGLITAMALAYLFSSSAIEKFTKSLAKNTLAIGINNVIKSIASFLGLKSIAVTKAGTVANYGFAASLTAATFGLILLVPLILGLIAGLVQMTKGLDDSSERTSAMGKSLQPLIEFFKQIWYIIVNLVKSIFNFGKALSSAVVALLAIVYAALKVTGILDVLRGILNAVNILISGFTWLTRQLAKFLDGIVDGIVNFIKGLISLVSWIPGTEGVVSGLGQALNNLGNFLEETADSLRIMNTELSDFGSSAQRSALALSEFDKGAAKIKALKKEYEELNKQANHTPEELERINEILDQLSSYSIGGKTFDFTKVNEEGELFIDDASFRNEFNKIDREASILVADINKTLDEAAQAYGRTGSQQVDFTGNTVGMFEDEGLLDSARYLGQRYGKLFIDELKNSTDDSKKIGEDLASSLSKGIANSMAKADKSFFDTFISGETFNQQKLNQYVTDLVGIASVEIKALDNTLKNLTGTDAEKAKLTIQAQADAYKKAIQELNKKNFTAAELNVATSFIGASMQDGVILNQLLNEKGFSVDAVINIRTNSNMSLTALQDFLNEEYQNVFKGIDNAENKAKFNTAMENAFSGTAVGIETGIMSFAEMLKASGYADDDFEEAINRISSAIKTLSAEATASLLEDQRKLNEKVFSLPEKIKKGDFKDYAELVAEFGVDAVEGILNGSETGVEDFLKLQTEKTTAGIMASISKITATAIALGRVDEDGNAILTDAEAEQVSMLQTMLSYYEEIVAVEQLRIYQLKQVTDLMKEAADLTKLQESLMKFGGSDSPILKTLDDMIAKTQELAKQKAGARVEDDLARLMQFGEFGEDGIFNFFDTDDMDISAANDALSDYMQSLTSLVDIQNQQYERQKKIIEETYKAEIEAIKKGNDEKWKAIEYNDRIAETEENIAKSRRELLGLGLSMASSGMVADAQKNLEKLKKERQKMIQQQMVEAAQQQLEMERDQAMQELGEEQLIAMSTLTDSILLLNRTMEEAADDDGDGTPNILDPDYLSN
jgi:TP901 family phage tail tape measure protein